jgi:hypothetical protein
LGPNIDGITPGFADKYNAVFTKANIAWLGVMNLIYTKIMLIYLILAEIRQGLKRIFYLN